MVAEIDIVPGYHPRVYTLVCRVFKGSTSCWNAVELYIGVSRTHCVCSAAQQLGTAFIQMGVVTMWVKVHFYSTDRSRVFMYISAEERAEYKKKLAEQPASCCSWLSKNHNKERQEALAAERAKRRPIVEVPKPTAPAKSTTRTSGGRVSVSGVELGLIQPNSGVATDVGEIAMGQKRQPAHHLTKMLPLDHDSQSPFRGFGKAHSHPEAEPVRIDKPAHRLARRSPPGTGRACAPSLPARAAVSSRRQRG